MLIYMRRYGVVGVTVGSDAAIVAWPIPAGGSLVALKGEAHLVPQEDIGITDVVMYAMEGWICRTEVLSDFQAMQTLWNAAVPKDTALSTLDEDDASDSQSFFEAGLVNLAQVFGQEVLGPERVFQREKMLSFANAPSGFKDATPDTYIPAEAFEINVRKKYTVRDFNGLLLGVGSPDYAVANDDDIIPQLGGLGTRQSFYALRFLQEFMDMAMISLIGLVEAGAETPYTDILTFIQELLERMNVGGGGSLQFEGTNWSSAVRATAGIQVPGMFNHQTLGPDAQA